MHEGAAHDEAPEVLDIPEAVRRLERGALVALPTETVYGLAADATNPEAVAAVFAAKGRSLHNPLIVHVANLAMAEALIGRQLPAEQRWWRHLTAMWPGPLTLVTTADQQRVLTQIRAGLPTMAVRWPLHPHTQAIIAQLGRPLVMPSANRSGYLSATTVAGVRQAMRGSPCRWSVVDGGACTMGVESTVVDITTDPPTRLRLGSWTPPATQASTWPTWSVAAEPPSTGSSPSARSPGMQFRHYAPKRPLVVGCTQWPDARSIGSVEDAGASGWGTRWCGRLGWGQDAMAVEADLNLSPTLNIAEAAANLYEHLRLLDRAPYTQIAVQALTRPSYWTHDEHTIWEAVCERLHRASQATA